MSPKAIFAQATMAYWVDVATKLRDAYPKLKIVILTNYAQEPYLRAMIKAGVDGYLLKDTPPSRNCTPIRRPMNLEPMNLGPNIE